MPVITRVFIKTSLIYLFAALIAGIARPASEVIQLPAVFGALNPVYFHLFLVGWVSQLIFGVVIWMFPKYSLAKPRGSDRLSWVVYASLNLGLILRTIAEPAQAVNPGSPWNALLVASASFQWLAGVIFVANTWPRVKER